MPARVIPTRRHLADVVDFDPAASQELDSIPVRERVALMHAREKLVALGARLPFPHQSDVRGAPRLRELRPRAGRSPWRGIYAWVQGRFVVLSVGPEAEQDPRGYARSVAQAYERLAQMEGDVGAAGEDHPRR
jgi:hypothetical protein